MTTTWRYSVTYGLSGCYMPDSHYGPYSGTTRKELAGTIRDMIEMSDFPKTSIRQIKLNRAWAFIKRNGSSSAHFSINHGANEIAFYGLTEDEFNEAERENEF